MTRPGFAFSTRFRVRYAEIDGQKVVFKHLYRVLYGNPRGGKGESLNARTIIRL